MLSRKKNSSVVCASVETYMYLGSGFGIKEGLHMFHSSRKPGAALLTINIWYKSGDASIYSPSIFHARKKNSNKECKKELRIIPLGSYHCQFSEVAELIRVQFC